MPQNVEKLLTRVSCALGSDGAARGLQGGHGLGRWEPGAAALPRLLLLSHDALHSPLLALQLPRCLCHSHLPSSCITFILVWLCWR